MLEVFNSKVIDRINTIPYKVCLNPVCQVCHKVNHITKNVINIILYIDHLLKNEYINQTICQIKCRHDPSELANIVLRVSIIKKFLCM